jgi:hypothetical protein
VPRRVLDLPDRGPPLRRDAPHQDKLVLAGRLTLDAARAVGILPPDRRDWDDKRDTATLLAALTAFRDTSLR